MKRVKESKTVSTRLPIALSDRFERAVKEGPYLTPAEFLRAAVAEKLDAIEKVN